MRNMRILRRVVYLAALGTLGALMVLFFSAYTLLATFSVLTFLAFSRQLNFYKIFMMLKQVAQKVAGLRTEFRARLHLGFRDYYGHSVDGDDEGRYRTHGYIR